MLLSNRNQLRLLAGLTDAVDVGSSHAEFVLPVSLQVLHVEGGAAAGGQVCPFIVHRVPDLHGVGLHSAAAVVGGAVPREREGGAPYV